MERKGGSEPFETVKVSFFIDQKNGIEVQEAELRVPIGAGQYSFCAALKGVKDHIVSLVPEVAKKVLTGSAEEEATINSHIEKRLAEWRELMVQAEEHCKKQREALESQSEVAGDQGQPERDTAAGDSAG